MILPPKVLKIGVNILTTLFAPGIGGITRRETAAAKVPIGRHPLSIVAMPSACTYTVATSSPGRVASTSTTGPRSVV